MQTAGSSETSINLRQTTRLNIPKYGHRRQNDKLIYRSVCETGHVTTEVYMGLETKRCEVVVDGWTVSPCRFTSRERKARWAGGLMSPCTTLDVLALR